MAAATSRGASPVQRLAATGYDWLFDRVDPLGGGDHRRRLVERAAGGVLEIGAGTGRNLPRYRTATWVVALEPAPGMRARAIQAARAARVAVEVVDGRAEDLPFPDAAVDTVVASLVLCTVPDLAQTLAEARRVPAPERYAPLPRARPGRRPAAGPLAGPAGATLGLGGRRLPPQPRRRGRHHRRRVPPAGAGPVRLPDHAPAGPSPRPRGGGTTHPSASPQQAKEVSQA